MQQTLLHTSDAIARNLHGLGAHERAGVSADGREPGKSELVAVGPRALTVGRVRVPLQCHRVVDLLVAEQLWQRQRQVRWRRQ
jgi:hypothetical protein